MACSTPIQRCEKFFHLHCPSHRRKCKTQGESKESSMQREEMPVSSPPSFPPKSPSPLILPPFMPCPCPSSPCLHPTFDVFLPTFSGVCVCVKVSSREERRIMSEEERRRGTVNREKCANACGRAPVERPHRLQPVMRLAGRKQEWGRAEKKERRSKRQSSSLRPFR